MKWPLIEILESQNLREIIKNVDFDEISGFQQGTLGVWDQSATTALLLGLSRAAKKLVFINGAYIFVKRVESGAAVEWSKKVESYIFLIYQILSC